MTIPEHTLRNLATVLPTRIQAARHGGIDCIRLTLPEAQALRTLVARELTTRSDTAIDTRKETQ